MRFIYLFLAGSMAFAACNNTTNKATTANDSTSKSTAVAQPVASILSDAGTQKLMDVVNKYYDVKNAFVATNASSVGASADVLVSAADSLRVFLQHDDAHKYLASYADTIAANAHDLVDLKNKDITEDMIKLPFSKLSDAFFVLLQKVQLKNGNIYRQYCPMAFNNKGAYWLSNESEIKNPYYGKKMLECGDVADSLK